MLRRKDFEKRNDRGAAVVEFALALPVLLMTMFGTVELGRAFWIRRALIAAATEAARVGAQSSCPRATQAEVIEAASLSLVSSGLMPSLATFSLTNTGGASGTELIVDMSYNVDLPVLSKLLALTAVSEGALKLSAHFEAENE